MTGPNVTRLQGGDLNELAGTLSAAKLPISDLEEPDRTFFRFADSAGLIGFAGIEGNEADRLLRSLVIAADRRGTGLGRPVLALLENTARVMGVQRLHLLTTTAAPFFRGCGYVDADRATAPASIAASREFTALCPASAAYLEKAL